MKNKRKYFGTDGIRGKANSNNMNASLALNIGMATAEYFTRGNHKHFVLIGKDTRLSNYTIEPSLTAGFLSMGMNVYLTGPLPTPGVSALVSSMRCDVGVMISASHNHYSDNGIKIFGPDGTKLSDKDELNIEKLIDSKFKNLVKPENLGRAKRIEDAGGRYIEYLKSKISSKLRLDGLKIVIDCANGAAYNVAPKILWELGATVIPINVSPDGTNVNENSGSTFPNNLINKVIEFKADVGIALDGDADRTILVDENGVIVDGDKIIAIIAQFWKKNNNLFQNTVVGTVMTNKALEDYFLEKKINLIRTDVGDRNIIQSMKEQNFVLGGEPSGHIILSNYSSTGDGILASLEVLGIMKFENKKLSTLANIYIPYPQIMQNFPIKTNQKSESIINNIKKKVEKKIDKKDARIVIRKSGTENKIRTMIEAKNLELAKSISKKIVSLMKEKI
ncbi:MAG: phosphoglucosamine mutase [Alphaproteobacteria bacterium]|nr:MAG: phosphoglucosamine mutase [Alphaproteobacteria bacterium]